MRGLSRTLRKLRQQLQVSSSCCSARFGCLARRRRHPPLQPSPRANSHCGCGRRCRNTFGTQQAPAVASSLQLGSLGLHVRRRNTQFHVRIEYAPKYKCLGRFMSGSTYSSHVRIPTPRQRSEGDDVLQECAACRTSRYPMTDAALFAPLQPLVVTVTRMRHAAQACFLARPALALSVICPVAGARRLDAARRKAM